MRNLASIQRIMDILPIENADKIEMAKVLGWECVVKKGQFKPGDFCVYFEIDSFLPIDDARFAFLRAGSYTKNELLGEGYKRRTQVFRGQISQGLVMPVSDFPEITVIEEHMDVTELLHVKKYEIPEAASSGGTIVGVLPSFVDKSDETRIQVCPQILDEFKGLSYYISTKMDGSSHSIGWSEDTGFVVTGHHYQYKDDGASGFYKFVKKHGFEDKLLNGLPEMEHLVHDVIKTISVSGEYCGPGMQKNRLKLTEPHWYVFSVHVNGHRLDLDSSLKTACMIGAEFVPIEERDIDLPGKYPDEKALLKRAEGVYPNGGQKEGIVIRPVVPVYSKILNDYLSVKIINNKYLLKHQD